MLWSVGLSVCLSVGRSVPFLFRSLDGVTRVSPLKMLSIEGTTVSKMTPSVGVGGRLLRHAIPCLLSTDRTNRWNWYPATTTVVSRTPTTSQSAVRSSSAPEHRRRRCQRRPENNRPTRYIYGMPADEQKVGSCDWAHSMGPWRSPLSCVVVVVVVVDIDFTLPFTRCAAPPAL